MKIKMISLSIALLLSLPLSANEPASSHLVNLLDNQTYTDEYHALGNLNAAQLTAVTNIEHAIENEDFAQAHSLSDQLLQSDPNLAAAHYLKAKTSVVEGTDALLFSYSLAQQAKKHFLLAEKLAPTNAKFKLALMSFYLNTPAFFGGNASAAENLIAPITALSTHYGFLAKLAYSAEFKGKEELEKLISEAQSKHQTDLTLQLLLGLTLWQSQQPDLAEQQLLYLDSLDARSTKDDETKQLTRYYLGKFCLKNKSEPTKGIDALNVFIQNHIGNTDDDYLPWAHYYLAQLLLQTEQLEDAKQHFNWLINHQTDEKLIKLAKKKLKQLPNT